MSGIQCVPAECWSGCEDPACPYTHQPAFFVVGYGPPIGPFSSRDGAEDQLTIRTGDDLTDALLGEQP